MKNGNALLKKLLIATKINYKILEKNVKIKSSEVKTQNIKFVCEITLRAGKQTDMHDKININLQHEILLFKRILPLEDQ